MRDFSAKWARVMHSRKNTRRYFFRPSPKLRKPTGRCPGGMGMLLSSSGASGVKVHGGELLATRWASTNSIRNDYNTNQTQHTSTRVPCRRQGQRGGGVDETPCVHVLWRLVHIRSIGVTWSRRRQTQA